VVVGGRRLRLRGVLRLRLGAGRAALAGGAVRVLQLVVGLAVDVLAGAVGALRAAVLAVRTGGARVRLRDDRRRAGGGERDGGRGADRPRDGRGDLVVRDREREREADRGGAARGVALRRRRRRRGLRGAQRHLAG